MDDLKERHEYAVADNVVRWCNERDGTNFVLHGRGSGEPVDVEFRDGDSVLHVQVTTAWYDQAHASFTWKTARGDRNAPGGWSGVNPDESLAASVANAVLAKCRMSYPPNTILVIAVYPNLTSGQELEEKLLAVELPASHPFHGIYVAGEFPSSRDGDGGYRCWRIDE